MTEIIISDAPKQYQRFLRIGDAHKGDKGNDGEINNQAEADAAAQGFCAENQGEECQKFLDYLEKSGYAMQGLQHEYSEKELRQIAYAAFNCAEALHLLQTLKECGVIDKYGLKRIRSFIYKFAHAVEKNREFIVIEPDNDDAQKSYASLELLLKKRVFDIFGIDNILKIAQAASVYTFDAFKVLIKLDEVGLIDKLTPARIVSIAEAMGGNKCGKAFRILLDLNDNHLIDNLDTNNLIATIRSIYDKDTAASRYLGSHFLSNIRNLSFILSPFLNFGSNSIQFRSLRGTNYVPPHPDDINARTNSINGNSGDVIAEFGIGAKIDFWQYAYLKYQLGFNSSIGQSMNGGEDGKIKEGDYTGQWPPPQRLQYASGENAYTFMVMAPNNLDPTHYITAGTQIPLFGINNQNLALLVDIGAVSRTYHVIRGWDRHASVEIMDRKKVNIWGATFGLGMQIIDNNNLGGILGIMGFSPNIRFTYFPGGTTNFTLGLEVPLGIGVLPKKEKE